LLLADKKWRVMRDETMVMAVMASATVQVVVTDGAPANQSTLLDWIISASCARAEKRSVVGENEWRTTFGEEGAQEGTNLCLAGG
jgi:hypothetical protein